MIPWITLNFGALLLLLLKGILISIGTQSICESHQPHATIHHLANNDISKVGFITEFNRCYYCHILLHGLITSKPMRIEYKIDIGVHEGSMSSIMVNTSFLTGNRVSLSYLPYVKKWMYLFI
jgi:hypothetical protein